MDLLAKIELIKRIEDKTEAAIDQMVNYPENLEKFAETIIPIKHRFATWVINKLDQIAIWLIDGMEKFANRYEQFAINAYEFARYTTFPFNYIVIFIYKLMMVPRGNLLYAHGCHYIYALQAGGKSSLLYHSAEHKLKKTGKGSYINADLERPYLDERSGWFVKHHKVFDLKEFFGVEIVDEKKVYRQMKSFNTRHFNNLILDEFLTELNHRMNNTSEYKEVFIPLIKSLSRSRHQRFECIWITSVLDKTDIQLMSLFKYIHEVEVDLDIDYWQWLKDGKFERHIKGWNLYTYAYKKQKKRSANEATLIKKTYIKKEVDMSRFDTLNQAAKFLELPKDQVNTTKGVV